MMLQFSYACGYYRERFKIYAGEDIFKQDDFVVEQVYEIFQGGAGVDWFVNILIEVVFCRYCPDKSPTTWERRGSKLPLYH